MHSTCSTRTVQVLLAVKSLLLKELLQGYQMIYGDNFNEDEVEAMINMADVNDDGVISYSEWLMIAMDRHKMFTHQKLEAAFQGMDTDHSNTVSLSEIANILFHTKQVD